MKKRKEVGIVFYGRWRSTFAGLCASHLKQTHYSFYTLFTEFTESVIEIAVDCDDVWWNFHSALYFTQQYKSSNPSLKLLVMQFILIVITIVHYWLALMTKPFRVHPLSHKIKTCL